MVFVCAYLRYSFSKFVHDKKKEDKNKQKTGEKKRKRKRAVSYTHLTLPTIDDV